MPGDSALTIGDATNRYEPRRRDTAADQLGPDGVGTPLGHDLTGCRRRCVRVSVADDINTHQSASYECFGEIHSVELRCR